MAVRVGSRPVAFKNPMTVPSNVESWSSSMKRCGPSPGNSRKYIPQLLHDPRRCRLAIPLDVPAHAHTVFDDEEAREQLEGQRGDGEEIACDDRLAVVGEEGRPAAGGIAAAWYAAQIAGDACFGEGAGELTEFPVDPGRAPVRILRCQATDQGPRLLADPRPASALSGSPAPVEAKAGSVPPDHGLRFHDEQHVRPSGPPMPEGGPE